MGTNFGCGSKSVFFRINGGDWNNIDSGDGKLLDLDGNFLLEAYSVDRFGQQSYRILSSYCALEQTRIYLRNAEIKDDNLQLALYQFGGVQVDLYKGIDKLDTLNSDSNVSKEFVLPLYDGLTSLDKLKICFPSGKCSPEINVFEVSTDLEKGKKAEFCGGEYSSISAVNLCLFSDFNSISDIDSSTCEYSLDGSDWTTATYSTFNAKRGCKVIIPKIDYSTHYISFRVSKTDSTVVFSPSSKALIQYNSVVTLCKYADCS
jgi:hypothetical protein